MSEYTLEVKINCDNAAFSEGGLRDEIYRIVSEQVLSFAFDIDQGGCITRRHLRDLNGNHVGTATACLDIDDDDENESEEK